MERVLGWFFNLYLSVIHTILLFGFEWHYNFVDFVDLIKANYFLMIVSLIYSIQFLTTGRLLKPKKNIFLWAN